MCRENAGGIAGGAPADSNLPIVAQPLLTSLSSVIAGGHHLGKKALDSQAVARSSEIHVGFPVSRFLAPTNAILGAEDL